MKGHLKHMAIGSAAVLVVLLIAGVNPGAALRWAVLLACPLGMVGMMMMMNRHGSGQADHDHEHGAHVGGDHAAAPEHTEAQATTPPLARLSARNAR
jgi:hypothetical protein